MQNTATNLGASLGTALIGSILIASLTTAFITGIQDNPAVPDQVKAQASVELASGVPFISDTDLAATLESARRARRPRRRDRARERRHASCGPEGFNGDRVALRAGCAVPLRANPSATREFGFSYSTGCSYFLSNRGRGQHVRRLAIPGDGRRVYLRLGASGQLGRLTTSLTIWRPPRSGRCQAGTHGARFSKNERIIRLPGQQCRHAIQEQPIPPWNDR